MNQQTDNNKKVWVWVEHFQGELVKASLGLLGKARELSQQLGGGEVASVLVGADGRKVANELISYGSDKLYLAESGFSYFETEVCARFMTELIDRYQPEIVLWSATDLGRETAARVAAKLETGLTAHCIDLYIEEVEGESQLISVVAGWGGNLALKIVCPDRRPQMATVKPGILSPPQPDKRSGEVIMEKVVDASSSIEVIEVVEELEEVANLEQADVVITGGWGLSSVGGFQPIEELAQILGGSVAGTRPALDAGWIPGERMIGQSGKTIAPRLLVTLGVSGAAQFATGIMNTKTILAVDRNPQAPIFEMADVGIVGDLENILPLLIEKLKTAKGKS